MPFGSTKWYSPRRYYQNIYLITIRPRIPLPRNLSFRIIYPNNNNKSIYSGLFITAFITISKHGNSLNVHQRQKNGTLYNNENELKGAMCGYDGNHNIEWKISRILKYIHINRMIQFLYIYSKFDSISNNIAWDIYHIKYKST